VAGTPALYERERDWEKVHIPGPIKEDILIYVSTLAYFSVYSHIPNRLNNFILIILIIKMTLQEV
jgi:hypothetical protein